MRETAGWPAGGHHVPAGAWKAIALAVVLPIAGATGWWYLNDRGSSAADTIAVYYTQPDGSTEASRAVALGPAHDTRSVAFFAATQAVAGPPDGVASVRFPLGTYVRSVQVDGSTVVVDLSKDVERLAGGSFSESAALKSLVWTMTGLPGIHSVVLLVDGSRVGVIPGGHIELDEPLGRSDW